MVYWDTSAIIPLLVIEPESAAMTRLAQTQPEMVVWWGTYTECESAIARRHRDGSLTSSDQAQCLDLLRQLAASWHEVLPTQQVRLQASLLLRRHPLRAADALQLAGACVWARMMPLGHALNTLDQRLAKAAHVEGFDVLQGPGQRSRGC